MVPAVNTYYFLIESNEEGKSRIIDHRTSPMVYVHGVSAIRSFFHTCLKDSRQSKKGCEVMDDMRGTVVSSTWGKRNFNKPIYSTETIVLFLDRSIPSTPCKDS